MKLRYYNLIFLIFLGTFQGALAEPISCSGALRIETSLAQNYRPYSGFLSFNDVPPWRYAKALLNESLPVVIQVKVENVLKNLESKNIHPYLKFARRFKTEPEVFKKWNTARDQFSRFVESDENAATARLLQSDIVIYNWIANDHIFNQATLQEAHEAAMGSHVTELGQNGEPIIVKKGIFRTRDVFGGNQKRLFPRYQEVPVAVQDFVKWFHLNEQHLHPLILAAQSYRWIVSIQPFRDGNKRTARVIADWILVKNGYPPLTAPELGYSLEGLVFGNISYEANARPWEFFDAFLTSVDHSLDLMNHLQSQTNDSATTSERH